MTPNRPALTADIAEIEISVKYEGLHQAPAPAQVAEFKRVEGHKLPPDMDYNAIQGLRLEARKSFPPCGHGSGTARPGSPASTPPT